MVLWDIGRKNYGFAMVGIVRIEDVSPEDAAGHHAGDLVGRQVQKSESQLDIAHLFTMLLLLMVAALVLVCRMASTFFVLRMMTHILIVMITL